MLFVRGNPKDKLGSFVEAAKKGQPPVGNWVEPQREEQSPSKRVGTALKCPGLPYNEHTVFFVLSVHPLWA